MEKSSKKKVKKEDKDEGIKKDDINKMYEVIKSKEILKELCHDALSDLNKKPSFINLKNMIDEVIKNSLENYTYESRPDQEHLQTRTLFTRLSILTYTIDSIISGLLCKKLNEEIKQIILTEINKAKETNNIEIIGENSNVNKTENVDLQSVEEESNLIDDAQQNLKLTDGNQKGIKISKTYSLASEAEKSLDAENQESIKRSKTAGLISETRKSIDTGNQKGSKSSKTASVISETEKSINAGNQKDIKSSKSTSLISETEKSNAGNKMDIKNSKTAGLISKTRKSIDAGNQKGNKNSETAGSISETRKSRDAVNQKGVKSSKTDGIVPEVKSAGKQNDIKSSKTSFLGSDAELSDLDRASDDDIDVLSLHGSDVSSVHTSDLSSFEDDISVSSEDEDGGKTVKHIPLKLARNLYDAGELSELLPVTKNKAKANNSTSSSPKSSKHNSPKSSKYNSPKSNKYNSPKSNKYNSPKSSKYESPKSSKHDDIPSKKLSTRVRKPNSKYSSDDIICPIKNILSQTSTNSEEMEADYFMDSYDDVQKEKPHKLAHKLSKILQNSPNRSDGISTNKPNSPSNHVGGIQSNHSSPKGIGPKKIKISFGEALNQTIEMKPKSLEKGENKKQGQPLNKKEANKTAKESSEIAASQPAKRFSETELPDAAARKKTKLVKTDAEKSPEYEAAKRRKLELEKTNSEKSPKKEVPSSSKTTDQTNKEPIKHSVESFSEFEESLCVKDKISSPKSSKSSTKSYDKSDLYKPHNDFRLSFNSRGSKATTLFSN